MRKVAALMMVLAIMLSGCKLPTGQTTLARAKSAVVATSTKTAIPTATKIIPNPTATNEPAPTASPTPFRYGPEISSFPSGINPLTGSHVVDPASLGLPAVLISITNFPPSARPQAGLSFASWVFELYISEGMTRFLTVFYGDYPRASLPESQPDVTKMPESTQTAGNTPSQGAGSGTAMVGPIRSGRLPYAYVRDFFNSSCLVYAGATVEIRDRLRGCSMVFGSDEDDINSAMLDVSKLQELAKTNFRQGDAFNYAGNVFSQEPPVGGKPAAKMDIFYSYLNQGQWVYDTESLKYLKFEDFADGSGKFRPMTDKLTGGQLAYANVIVIYAEHTVINPYIIDVNIGAGQRGKAVIFRDGQRYDAVWTTLNGDYEKQTGKRRPMRFEDVNGNPFPLGLGQSWIHIFTPYSYIEDKLEGNWLLRFVAPAGTK